MVDDVPMRADACSACGEPLAPEQRFCLSCGARRGTFGDAGPPVPWPLRILPGPWALAACVLAALATGVFIGSVGGNRVAQLADAPMLLILNHPRVHTATAPSTALADAGGSSSGDTGGSDSGGGSGSAASGGGSGGSGSSDSSSTGSGSGSSDNSGGENSGSDDGSGSGSSSGNNGILGLPPIKHVFLIVLSGQGYIQSFGPGSTDTYLSRTLPKQGELLADYYSVASSSAANGIALISGQGPTGLSEFDCPMYVPITGSHTTTDGQVVGSGCVYPASTPTLPGELTKHKLTWRAYVDGMGTQACRHPAPNTLDPNLGPLPNDPYVTWRNPFVYFTSLTSSGQCAKNDVALTQLSKDLRTTATTPSLSYIVPSPCEDGSDTPCATNAPAGLPAADTFLRKVIAEIEASPAYKANGLIAVTFDEAPQSGPDADPSACCNTPAYPNLPATATPTTTSTTATTTTTDSTAANTTTTATDSTAANTTTTASTTTTTGSTTDTSTTGTTTTGTTTTGTTTTSPATNTGQTTPTGGGGQVGLLLLSQYVKPGTLDVVDYYNHFSLLATIENLFGLPRLGYATDPTLPVFDASIFNAHAP